jgi:short-subunit dehydrogenase
MLSFSEAVDNEVKDKSVTVTAFCPGATESGFQAAATMEKSALVKGRKLPTSKEVTEYGYNSMMKGKTVAIHGLWNYLLANSIHFTPRALVVKITRMIQDKTNELFVKNNKFIFELKSIDSKNISYQAFKREKNTQTLFIKFSV